MLSFAKLTLLVTDRSLRNKVLFVLGALVIFRVLAAIPIPGVDATRLQGFLDNNQFLGLLNLFSGGGLSTLSIIMLGVGPYITSSIIMQLMTLIFPRLKALYHEEGEAGRKKFVMYSRVLTVPLAILQGFALIAVLVGQGVIGTLTASALIVNIAIVTAGSMLLMWLGELISEFGIGNGISIIIFAGIVAALPSTIQQLIFTFDISQIPVYIGIFALALLSVMGVVAATEAERPIPITHTKQAGGGAGRGSVSTYLPLRINQAGVIPIIFSLSILILPQMLGQFLRQFDGAIAQAFSEGLLFLFNHQTVYGVVYFLLVVFFTYFYTAVTFDPENLASNLQKSGAFIPGVRPGKTTAEHITFILSRITLPGALFLGIIAILPIIVQGVTHITSLTIGGTALLIVVSVVIDLVKKIDAQLSMREY